MGQKIGWGKGFAPQTENWVHTLAGSSKVGVRRFDVRVLISTSISRLRQQGAALGRTNNLQ